jgi:sucrose-6-phosphate hydrolase SacC (GH32 family)
LDVFVDGMVVEVFANGGEKVVTATHPSARENGNTSITVGPGIVGKASGGKYSATVAVTAWAMQPSIV